MTKVFVASKNPVKIASAREAFSEYFEGAEAVGVDISALLPDQPIGIETFTSAERRAGEVFEKFVRDTPDSFAAGIEGGIMKIHTAWFSFGCVCLIDSDARKSFGTSAMFPLPESWVEQLRGGKELGKVIDEVTGKTNTKQAGGAIGFLSLGKIDRTRLYTQGIISALLPFHHAPLYFNQSHPNG